VIKRLGLFAQGAFFLFPYWAAAMTMLNLFKGFLVLFTLLPFFLLSPHGIPH